MTTKYDQLLTLINTDNPGPIPFTIDNVIFSDPVQLVNHSKNTKITLTAEPGGGLLGNLDVFYDRTDLQAIGSNIWLFTDIRLLRADIINLINSTRNTVLLDSDLMPFTIPIMNIGDTVSLSITATSTSVNYKGTTILSLFLSLPIIANKLGTLMNNTFSKPGYLA